MRFYDAIMIFCNLFEGQFSDTEKAEALRQVLALPTKNGIKKEAFVEALAYAFQFVEAKEREQAQEAVAGRRETSGARGSLE